MKTQLHQPSGLRLPCCQWRDHLISSAVSRDDSPPSLLRDPLTVNHHVGHRLRRFNAERASHKAGSLTSSRRGPNTALPLQGSHRAAAERDESAEFLEPDLWQLEEPLGASPGLGSLDSQDDGVDAFWGAASSYSNPFEEQDGDPALAERRLRSLSGSPSTSGRSSAAFKGSKKNGDMDNEEATELIFTLEKRGSGWGEELFPRLTVEQRPIKKRIRIRNRSQFPDAWQADPGRLWAPASCRRLPAAVAVAPERLRACKQLLTWGALLPHGPARRHAAVRMRCLAYAQGHAEAHLHASGHGQAGGTLHAHAGLHGQASLSEHGQASPHGQMPRVKVHPQEGSAERYLMDQCGVPESAVESVIQRAVTWRVTAAGRSLIDRRHRSKVERNMPIVGAYLTDVCGVAPGAAGVGKVFQMSPCIMRCKPTQHDRWERRAIELAAYLYRHGHANVPEVYDPAPELGLWVRKQRTAKEQGTLSEERLQILLELDFEFGEEANLTEEWEWRFDLLVELLFMREGKSATGDIAAESAQDWVCMEWGAVGGPAAREAVLWVQLQREFYRRNLLPMVAVRRLDALGFQWEPTGGMEWQRSWMRAFARMVYVIERGKKTVIAMRQQEAQEKRRQLAQQTSLTRSAQEPPKPRRARRSPADLFEGLQPEIRSEGLAPAGLAAQRWLREEMELRQAALKVARLEPGQRAWMARQQRAWRRGGLLHEQVLLLALSGCDLELYDAAEWRQTAHDVAAYLMGSQIHPALGMPSRVMLESPPQHITPSPRSLNPALDQSSTKRSRRRPRKLLAKAGSQPAWERELQESKQAQLQRSQSSVALVQRSLDFEEDIFDSQEMSDAAAAWEDIIEAGGLPKAAEVQPLRGTPPGRPPGWRLRIVRWVETQRQLWSEQRLNSNQLRYMALLGITWVLSDEVVHMSDDAWQQRYLHLKSIQQQTSKAMVDCLAHSEALHDWLEHQRALAALGWLTPERECRLSLLGVDWRPGRAEDDVDWDSRMTELLAYRRQQGHVLVVEWKEAPDLAAWLDAARLQWQQGQLADSRVSQLTALGVQPMS